MSDPWQVRGLLGRVETRRMERDGWRFSDRAIRTADAYAMWAQQPSGDPQLVWLADPETYPEAWPVQAPADDVEQLQLFQEAVA